MDTAKKPLLPITFSQVVDSEGKWEGREDRDTHSVI